jgi:hypothetical protein
MTQTPFGPVIDCEHKKPNGVFDLSVAPNATTLNPAFRLHTQRWN